MVGRHHRIFCCWTISLELKNFSRVIFNQYCKAHNSWDPCYRIWCMGILPSICLVHLDWVTKGVSKEKWSILRISQLLFFPKFHSNSCLQQGHPPSRLSYLYLVISTFVIILYLFNIYFWGVGILLFGCTLCWIT